MSDTTNSPSTLVEVYENCLGRPFRRKDLSRHPLTHKEVSSLARAVGEHYKTHRVPQKPDFELRPSISPGSNDSVGLDYVFSKKHFPGNFEYRFDRTTEGEMTANLKRYLLYCHSLVFQDPLPYLLDYFEDGTQGDTALRRLPAVNALLLEYADLKGLIKQGILIPVSQPAIYLSDLPVLDDATLSILEGRLPQFSPTKLRALASEVLEEQYRRRRFHDEVDLCFPHPDNVFVLREILKLTEQNFSSADIVESFGLSILGSVSSINPQALTTDDLVRIRNHDQLFEEWRGFVSHVFREIQSREQNYTSVEAEFVLAVREEFLSWRHKFDAKLKSGSLDHALAESGPDVSIGVVSGAVTGIFTADPIAGVLAGSVTAMVRPTVGLLRNIVQASVKRRGAVTLRHHFLALGVSDDELSG